MKTTEQFVICKCQNCSGNIEFDASKVEFSGRGDMGAGPTISCPHCGLDTILFIPQFPKPKAIVAQQPRQNKKERPIPIFWMVVGSFSLILSAIFGGLYLHEKNLLERTQRALAMTEQSSAEFKANVEAAIRTDHDEKKQTIAQKIDLVCGIYQFSQFSGEQYDIRSDGTAQYSRESTSGFFPVGRLQSWNFIGEKDIRIGNRQFTIEQDDLIDEHGNRWIHIR